MTQSAADGYTLFCGGDFLATNRYLYSPTIDPITDLTPVTLICTYANVMVVPKTSPAKTTKAGAADRMASRVASPTKIAA
jgi:tripartite-type tricarboxylate transporter receptor subunit TctC